MMHFSIYIGSELELSVKKHTNKAHFSKAGYYFLMIFLKNAGFRMWPPSRDTIFSLSCQSKLDQGVFVKLKN